jgi:hypothetical protein
VYTSATGATLYGIGDASGSHTQSLFAFPLFANNVPLNISQSVGTRQNSSISTLSSQMLFPTSSGGASQASVDALNARLTSLESLAGSTSLVTTIADLRDNSGSSALVKQVGSVAARLTAAEGLTGSSSLVRGVGLLQSNVSNLGYLSDLRGQHFTLRCHYCAVTNTWAPISGLQWSFGSVSASSWNPASNMLTFPSAGMWLVRVGGYILEAPTTSARYAYQFYLNGFALPGIVGGFLGTVGDNPSATVVQLISVPNAGSTLQVWMYQATSSVIHLGSQSTPDGDFLIQGYYVAPLNSSQISYASGSSSIGGVSQSSLDVLATRVAALESFSGTSTLVQTVTSQTTVSAVASQLLLNVTNSLVSLTTRVSALDATPLQFTDVSFQNGWSQYTDTSFGLVSYAIRGGRVYLRGLATGTTVGVPIFTLPINFRSAVNEMFSQQCADGISTSGVAVCEVRVHTDGVVQLTYGSGAVWLSLHGIHFAASAASTQV